MVFVDPKWNEDEREMIVGYLKWGLVARAYCGPSMCRFCGIRNGSLELTDGVFVWPEGLAHYVAEHHVRLPHRFVEHVDAERGRYDEVPIDDDWWREQRGTGSGGGRPSSA